MSRTPCFFVERYNDDIKAYDLQHPLIWNYGHKKRVPADLFPYNGCHEMFSIVEDENRFDIPRMNGIHYGLPKDVCADIKKEYEEWTKDTDYKSNVRWFTYADMYIYLLENPKVVDYDSDSDNINDKKDNPLFALKKRVDSFLNVMEDWDWRNDYSIIRIVYWID